jgi:hypothetical protein
MARGVPLGNPKQANKPEADRYANALRPILNELCHMAVENIVDEPIVERSGRPPRISFTRHCDPS